MKKNKYFYPVVFSKEGTYYNVKFIGIKKATLILQ